MIKNIPESDRPMEKMIELGAKNLSNAELLANIFRIGTSKKTAIELSRDLLRKCDDDITNLSNYSIEEMMSIEGIGIVKACKLHAALELSRRVFCRDIKGETLRSPNDVVDYFDLRFRDSKVENVVVVYLSTKANVLGWSTISIGSLNQTVVHPREVFKEAIKKSAASIILIHNHPSGDSTPSKQDDVLTIKVKEAGDIIGIQLTDHIIIGAGNYYSYVENTRL